MPIFIALFASWLGQFVITILVVALGVAFSDVLLGFVADTVSLAATAVTGAEVDLPSVGEFFDDLSPDIKLLLRRLRVDDAISIIITAISLRFVGSMFGALRGLRRGVTP